MHRSWSGWALSSPAGFTQFGWDARGCLASLATPSTTAEFTYGALGRRVDRRVGIAPTSYPYDGFDITQDFTATGRQSYLRTLAIDVGSAVVLTNTDGALGSQYTYAPFGLATSDGGSTNPLPFTDREDDGTGLYYYRARYYHAGLGR